MNKSLVAAMLVSSCVALAQAPNFSGVWKANLEKSKFAGPPPTSYLMLIDQQGSKITQTVGLTGQHGEQRSMFTYDIGGGHASRNTMMGTPMQTTAAIDGATLKLTSKLATEHGGSGTETWTLSPEGAMLTIVSAFKMGEHGVEQTLVLEKQPDSAGDPLRKPEQTAVERFKNVQIAKDMPASQFIDMMRSFTWSLGIECDHCHVQGNFASDEKEDKAMARKMMTMTHNINESTFGGHQEVRCYTCHRGQHEPQSRPAFQ
jgi:hypothetical protein